jgi:hypothetical protein
MDGRKANNNIFKNIIENKIFLEKNINDIIVSDFK